MLTTGVALFFLLPRIEPCTTVPAAFAQSAKGGEAQGSGEKPLENAWVVPEGKEDVLAEILGRGETLPGPCKFAGGAADPTTVHATYTCPGGEVVFALSHPSKAPAGTTQTERFAIRLQSGAPPDGFTDALVARIRSHEATFQWNWIGATTSTQRSSRVVGGLLIFAAALGVGVLLIRRRRQRLRAHP